MKNQEQRNKEIENKLEKINRELAKDIMELENLHKPIETAHELSRREYKTVMMKMQVIHEISRRCITRLEALQYFSEEHGKKTES